MIGIDEWKDKLVYENSIEVELVHERLFLNLQLVLWAFHAYE